jgi:hypothetical protein
MPMTEITFRSEPDVGIEYHDHGWESDTNAHPIDWRFVDVEKQRLELTPEEEQAIEDHLSGIVSDPGYDYGVDI